MFRLEGNFEINGVFGEQSTNSGLLCLSILFGRTLLTLVG